MAALGYLEILDSKGGVSQRVKIDAWPATLGRAYTNDVILDDPFVCPLHATIALDESGRLVITDFNSINGIYRDGAAQRVASFELASGGQFRVGRTHLCYRSAEHPLTPTLVDLPVKKSLLASPLVTAVVVVALAAVLIVDAYLANPERASLASLLGEPLITLSMLMTWAGAWALAARIIISRFNFPQHLTIGCLVLLAVSGFGIAAEWSEFFLPRLPILRISGMLGYGLMIAALVYFHLSFASPLKRSSRLWSALAISLLVVGTGAITDFAARSKFSNVMEYSGVVKPVDAPWVPAETVAQFIGDTNKLKAELAALADKAKAGKP